jgi:hypothetical protein
MRKFFWTSISMIYIMIPPSSIWTCKDGWPLLKLYWLIILYIYTLLLDEIPMVNSFLLWWTISIHYERKLYLLISLCANKPCSIVFWGNLGALLSSIWISLWRYIWINKLTMYLFNTLVTKYGVFYKHTSKNFYHKIINA